MLCKLLHLKKIAHENDYISYYIYRFKNEEVPPTHRVIQKFVHAELGDIADYNQAYLYDHYDLDELKLLSHEEIDKRFG